MVAGTRVTLDSIVMAFDLGATPEEIVQRYPSVDLPSAYYAGTIAGSTSRRAMIRFAADEDFNDDVVRALRRSLPDVNIVGVREARRGGRPDPDVLAWAEEGRVLPTHDVTTMTRHALERVARGEPMPGL